MRSRLFLLVAVAALVASAWLYAGRRRDQRNRAAALRALTLAARFEACVAGDGAPRDAPSLTARLRRIALALDTAPAWPQACASQSVAIVDLARESAPLAALSRRAAGLASALESPSLGASVQSFRAGRGDAQLGELTAALRALRVELGVVATAYRQPLGRAHTAGAPSPLPPVGGDMIPVSVAAGSTVAGWNYAGGTLSALFIEPTRERVFCRSRDRGGAWRCKRFAREGAPQYLVANDDPEAIALVESARGATAFASLDALAQPIFSLPWSIVSSLPARVAGSRLVAVVDDAGASSLARCVRGGACSRDALAMPARRESVLVAAGPERWWLGVAGEGSLSLDARRIADEGGPLGAASQVVPLRSTAALLASCHAPGVAYVAVVDAPGTHLVAIEAGHAPRSLGSLSQGSLPFELVCDARGATLVGDASVQSCALAGGCAPKLAVEGPRRFARVGGELVMVSVARDGDGLRVRRGDPMRFASATTTAIDDDAAHGGVSARALWLFTAGDRLVLFATGATTTVLYSDDRGARWTAAREGFDGTVRPMRMTTPPRP
jgi:hypothetical protein